MGDLLSILSSASSSLGAHRAASATAGHNLENANTPGYARQRADLGAVTEADALGMAFLGRGVTLLGIGQARDRFLEAQLPGALASRARGEAEASALEAFSAFAADVPGGPAEALGDFFAGLRALSQNPSDPTLRLAAVEGARGLARSLRTAADAVADARAAIDDGLAGQLAEVNGLARQVAELNGRIRISAASGARPNDLLDARQRAQDRLAELTGATPIRDGAGDVHLSLPGGVALVTGERAATLSAEPDPANGGLLAIRIVRTDGSGPAPVAASALGGAIGGALDARDGALKRTADGLEALAYDLGTKLNELHAAGVGADGVSGRPLFVGLDAAAGAALAIEVSPDLVADPSRLAAAAPGGASGDASTLFALIAAEEAPLSGGRDAVAAMSALVSGFGAAASRARATADQDGALLSRLEELRAGASGVSVDEELIELTKAQRAYEAVSKVIVAADEMLETLMKLR